MLASPLLPPRPTPSHKSVLKVCGWAGKHMATAAIPWPVARRVLIAMPFLAANSFAAAAPTERCGGLQMGVLGQPPPQWAAAVTDTVLRLRGRDDLDRCARLELEFSGSAMVVHVLTIDGRAAARRVVAPSELAVTVQALVTLPPTRASAPVPPSALESPEIVIDAAPRVQRHAPAHFELGLGASTRLAAAPLYGGLGVQGFAQIELQQWLVAISARWDIVNDLLSSPSPTGFNMQTVAVGGFVGRRFETGGLNLDGQIGPAIVVENQEAEGSADGLGGNAVDVRADALVRLSRAGARQVRFFVSADIDVSPSRLRRSKQIDRGLPSVPSWSAGAQLGILWGTP